MFSEISENYIVITKSSITQNWNNSIILYNIIYLCVGIYNYCMCCDSYCIHNVEQYNKFRIISNQFNSWT